MDKIDEWMNRAFEEAPSEKPSTSEIKKKQPFSKNKAKAVVEQKKQVKKQVFKKKRHAENKVQKNIGKKYEPRKQVQNHKAPQGQASKRKIEKGVKSVAPKKAPKATEILKGKLKIIPIGGLDEVGKNMTAIEYENDIIVIDMGFEFPSEDLFGVDYVIPDISYLEENKKRIKGIFFTHGHLDHIGGVPYILPELDYPPIYATRLTMGLIRKRSDEFKQTKMMKMNVVDPKETIKIGAFTVNMFRVAHSIPDSVGFTIDTPVGKIVHTGDFKFDDAPARNLNKADIGKIEKLGTDNVLALLCESTNSTKEGHSMSEKKVGEVLDDVVGETKGRLIIASFSSQIGRIQQVLDSAKKHGRNVYVSGRSMRENINISAELGYLHFSGNLIQDIKKYKKDADNKTLILTTGSQGESVSALTRMANRDHPHVRVKKGDTIVLSASPIVGNEKAIFTVINNLIKLGATVIHNKIKDVHTSGHGKRDELKRMIDMVKPRFLVPIHGEYYMRHELGNMAMQELGFSEDRIVMIENGEVLVGSKDKIVKSGEKVETKYILIDGTGQGQKGSDVQFDRQMMSENGALVILIHVSKNAGRLKKTPDIVSRGFIYMHESKEITEEIAEIAGEAYRSVKKKNPKAERREIKAYVKQTIDKYTRYKLERRPLIIPLIIES